MCGGLFQRTLLVVLAWVAMLAWVVSLLVAEGVVVVNWTTGVGLLALVFQTLACTSLFPLPPPMRRQVGLGEYALPLSAASGGGEEAPTNPPTNSTNSRALAHAARMDRQARDRAARQERHAARQRLERERAESLRVGKATKNFFDSVAKLRANAIASREAIIANARRDVANVDASYAIALAGVISTARLQGVDDAVLAVEEGVALPDVGSELAQSVGGLRLSLIANAVTPVRATAAMIVLFAVVHAFTRDYPTCVVLFHAFLSLMVARCSGVIRSSWVRNVMIAPGLEEAATRMFDPLAPAWLVHAFLGVAELDGAAVSGHAAIAHVAKHVFLGLLPLPVAFVLHTAHNVYVERGSNRSILPMCHGGSRGRGSQQRAVKVGASKQRTRGSGRPGTGGSRHGGHEKLINAGANRRGGGVPGCTPPAAIQDRARVITTQLEDADQPKTPRTLCVISPPETFAWYQGSYTTQQEDGSWQTTDGDVVQEVVRAGVFCCQFVADPIGTMVERPDHPGRIARFPFFYEAPNHATGYTGGWVFVLGLRKLREKFAACDASEHTLRAATNRLLVDYPTLPIQVVASTVAYHRLLVNSVNAALPSGAKLSSLPPPCELDRIVNAVRDLGVTSIVSVGLNSLTYGQCELRPPTSASERRDLFRVVRAKGAKLVDGQLSYATHDDRALKTYLRAFRLGGPRQFVRFNRTANNQAASLCRPYKARGGSAAADDSYTARQLALLDDVVSYTAHPYLRALGSMRKDADGYVFTRGSWTKVFPATRTCRTANIAASYMVVLDAYSQVPSYHLVYVALNQMWAAILATLQIGVTMPAIVCLFIYDLITFRWYYGLFPHDKKKLRQRVGAALWGANRLGEECMVQEITAEVKDEPAKVSKPPRQYFSLGPESSMFGGAHVAMAKHLMGGKRTVYIGSDMCHLIFVDNNRAVDMGIAFADAFEARLRRETTIFYFSDDILIVGPEEIMGLDISMCDGSHSFGIFVVVHRYLVSAGVPVSVADGLLEQLTKPFRMRNPANRDEYILCRFLSFYLVSGTTLTTITNNFAALLIASAYIAAAGAGDLRDEELNEWIADTGYVVTREPCAVMEQASMLKRFPCRTECGGVAAPLCLGALLKNFGDITTILDESVVPGSAGLPLEERAFRFLCGVTASWKNEPRHPLIDVLCEVFPPNGSIRIPRDGLWKHSSQRDVRRLDVVSICARYNVEVTEYYGLVEALGTLRSANPVGLDITSPFMEAVMRVDYGL